MLILLYVILSVVLPPCPTEDSDWCHWDDGDGTAYVSLWMRDPAPWIITEEGRLE